MIEVRVNLQNAISEAISSRIRRTTYKSIVVLRMNFNMIYDGYVSSDCGIKLLFSFCDKPFSVWTQNMHFFFFFIFHNLKKIKVKCAS